jgi:hypothetical protein
MDQSRVDLVSDNAFILPTATKAGSLMAKWVGRGLRLPTASNESQKKRLSLVERNRQKLSRQRGLQCS